MQKYKLDLDEIIQDCERFAVKVEKGEGLHGITMNGEEFDVTEVMENCMDECKDCEKAPSHISKCFSETGYCKYFPYEMPECFGKREDLRIPIGKWITVDYPKEGILYMCDQCGDVQEGRTIKCPDCGARMMIDYGKTPEPIPWSQVQKRLMENKNGL